MYSWFRDRLSGVDSGVLNIATSEIEETPEFEERINAGIIQAMSKTRDRVIMLLDINKVITTEELFLAKIFPGTKGIIFVYKPESEIPD